MKNKTLDERNLEIRQTLVTALMTSVIFNESMDAIKDSTFHDGKLKTAGKQFEIQITNKCNKMANDLWKFDENRSCELTNSIRNIAQFVATLKPSEIVTFSDAINAGNVQFTHINNELIES